MAKNKKESENLSRRGARVSTTEQSLQQTQQQGRTASMVKTSPTSSRLGLDKMASAQVVRALPKIYSPLYENSNLQLPRDLRTLNAWRRHFKTTNPIVRNAVNLHSTYPISKWNLKCEDQKVNNFFIDLFDHIDMKSVLLSVSNEYWTLGERLDEDSLITMGDGSIKKIKNIRVGEEVITHTGSIKKVLSVMPKPTLMPDEEGNSVRIYKVKVVGHNKPLIITGNHPVYSELLDNIRCSVPYWGLKKNQKCWPNRRCSSTQTKNGKKIVSCKKSKQWNFDFRKMSKLQKGDQTAFAFNREVVDQTDLTNEWCYLFGLYLSKGCINYNILGDGSKTESGINISTSEKELNDRIVSTMTKVSSYEPKRHMRNIEHINLYDSLLAKAFKKYGGEHAHTKKLHKEIMLLPPEKQLYILSGFIDGDGSVDKSNGQVQISTSSRSLINQFINMLARLDIGAVLTQYRSKPNELAKATYDIKDNYRLTIKSFDTEIFRSYIMPRKANLLRPAKKRSSYGVVWNNLYIRSIQKIEDITDSYSKKLMYDLEVEEDHSYIANNIVVHNCFPYAELDENNGVWDYIFCHNPDYIRVKTSALARDPIITLVPDDALMRLVKASSPADIKLREQLPTEIIWRLQQGQDIPLSHMNVSHLKMLSADYDVRGTSIIDCCFKDLMLYDKIRESMYAQADDMINPLTLIKLGDPTGTFRPDDADIAEFRRIYEEAQYDLSFKLVTHGAVSIEKIGNNGAVLDTSQMWEQILKNIFIGLFTPETVLNGEGASYACFDKETEVLTNRGFKKFSEVIETKRGTDNKNLAIGLKDKEIEIACFNPQSEELEYHSPQQYYAYDFSTKKSGEKLVKFQTNKIDVCVTPNHNMWVDKRKTSNGWHNKWSFERADEVKTRVRRFRSKVNWRGTIPSETVIVGDKQIDLDTYLRFAGYYVSEGDLAFADKKRIKKRRVNITQQQYVKGIERESFKRVQTVMNAFPYEYKEYKEYKDSQRKEVGIKTFSIYNTILAEHLREEFGFGSLKKKLPQWIKNLPPKKLKVFLETYVDGDGSIHTSNDFGRGKNSIKQYSITTVSKQLADDIYEIVYKIGFVPIISKRIKNIPNQNDLYVVYWTESEMGEFPTLDTRSEKLQKQAIEEVNYEGQVYCFEVPYHLFVTRRNGKITIQGNSAGVGLEVLRARYERFRDSVEFWMRKKIMEPMCKIHDFYKYEDGERKLIIPQIVWNKINLRDIDTYLSNIIGLLGDEGVPGSGKISTKTLFEFIDVNYEAEKTQKRKEMIDTFITQKEVAALNKMSLEELRSIDGNKPIVDLHEEEADIPIPGETEEGEGGGEEAFDLGEEGGGEIPFLGGGEGEGIMEPAPEGAGAGLGAPEGAPTPGEGPGGLGV